MTAGDLLVQMPPDAFDGIRVGRSGRQGVEDEAMAPVFKILLDGVAFMAAGIITEDMDFAGRVLKLLRERS